MQIEPIFNKTFVLMNKNVIFEHCSKVLNNEQPIKSRYILICSIYMVRAAILLHYMKMCCSNQSKYACDFSFLSQVKIYLQNNTWQSACGDEYLGHVYSFYYMIQCQEGKNVLTEIQLKRTWGRIHNTSYSS